MMTKKEFEDSEKPLTFICSINPKTGKVLSDFYDGWNNDFWVKDFRKDFPEMITFIRLNKSALKLRAKEMFNMDLEEENAINVKDEVKK